MSAHFHITAVINAGGQCDEPTFTQGVPAHLRLFNVGGSFYLYVSS